MPKKDIRELVSKEEILNNAFVAFMIYLERFDKKNGDKVHDNNAILEIVIDKINNSPFYNFIYDDLISDKKDKELHKNNQLSKKSTSLAKEEGIQLIKEYGADSIIGAVAKYAINDSDRNKVGDSGVVDESRNSKDEINSKLDSIVSYISDALNSDECHLFYLKRLGNDIEFGEMKSDIRNKILDIPVTHLNTFKSIYEYISAQFADNFKPSSKHTFGYGWSLLPTIGENVMIDIDSRDPHDRSWFYQEAEKLNKINESKNKNLK